MTLTKGSESRSKKGSKKRTNKTRSSLNIIGGIPLGNVASSFSALPGSMNKSKKIAAQIYGNASALNNLVSQRKKTNSQSKKKAGSKRAQPM